MKCPHCKKYRCEPDVVYKNVESYGSRHVSFRCVHCDKVVSVYAERRVVYGLPEKTDLTEGDWG